MSLCLTKCSKDPPEGIGVLGSAPSFKSRNTETQQTSASTATFAVAKKGNHNTDRETDFTRVKCPQAILGMSTVMFVMALLQQHVRKPVLHTLTSHNVSFAELHNPLTH